MLNKMETLEGLPENDLDEMATCPAPQNSVAGDRALEQKVWVSFWRVPSAHDALGPLK